MLGVAALSELPLSALPEAAAAPSEGCGYNGKWLGSWAGNWFGRCGDVEPPEPPEPPDEETGGGGILAPVRRVAKRKDAAEILRQIEELERIVEADQEIARRPSPNPRPVAPTEEARRDAEREADTAIERARRLADVSRATEQLEASRAFIGALNEAQAAAKAANDNRLRAAILCALLMLQ